MSATTLPVKDLHPHPDNPRTFGKDWRKDPGLVELGESLKAIGQLLPILCRANGKGHQIIAGERRWRGLQIAGLDTAEVKVVDVDDQQAFAMLMTENAQRQDVHPVEEARAIAAMRKRGWTLEDMASTLGCSVATVARRAQLDQLVPKWLELWLDEPGIPARHMELIASLEPDTQEALQFWAVGRGFENLKSAIAQQTALLSCAPWGLDDAELVPAAGACSSCTKRTGAQPSLFDGIELETYGSKKPKSTDRCLSAECWAKKQTATVARKREGLKAKHGELLEQVEYSSRKPGPGQVHRYDLEPCKKSDKGAVLVLVTEGEKAGQTYWAKPRGGRPTGSGRGLTAAEKRERQQRKERRACGRLLADKLEALPVPTAAALLPLVLRFRIEAGTKAIGESVGVKLKVVATWDQSDKIRRAAVARAQEATRYARALVWQAVLATVTKELRGDWLSDVGLKDVAAVFGVDLAPIRKQAKAATAPKKKRPSKKKASKKKASKKKAAAK